MKKRMRTLSEIEEGKRAKILEIPAGRGQNSM
jgi:hypothetical protein